MEMILGIRAMGRDTPHDPRELQAPSLDTHRDPRAATATLGIPAQPLQPSQPGILSRKGTGRIWGVQQWALPGVAHSLVWHGNILNPHFPQAWSSWLGKQEGSQLFWEEALGSGTPGMCGMPGVFPMETRPLRAWLVLHCSSPKGFMERTSPWIFPGLLAVAAALGMALP